MIRRFMRRVARAAWHGFNNFLADDLLVAIYLLFITAAGIGAAYAQFVIATGGMSL